MNDQQIERYARHILLAEVGGAGQQRLLRASVAIAGTSPGADMAALYLCAAGVGTLRLDRALVATTREELSALNPDVTITDMDGPTDVSLAPGASRMDGALAAHRALMLISGAAAPDEQADWKVTSRGGRWD